MTTEKKPQDKSFDLSARVAEAQAEQAKYRADLAARELESSKI